MEQRTFTSEQIVLLGEILGDTLDTWAETRSELARDEGSDSESVQEQDKSIAELEALIAVVEGK